MLWKNRFFLLRAVNHLTANRYPLLWHTVISPGGFHPQALSEPDLNLSIHPAPIIQPNAISSLSSVQIAEVPCEQELLAICPLLCDLAFCSVRSIWENSHSSALVNSKCLHRSG